MHASAHPPTSINPTNPNPNPKPKPPGALLYEMLTGLPPFYCRDREKLFEKIRTAELTFPKFVSAPARYVIRTTHTPPPIRVLCHVLSSRFCECMYECIGSR